ncbi:MULTISPECIES: hypothetical protein [Pseudomonas]|uniref:Uncharacterized protein n=1 Tax=Pseudomonas koreensis TaxID=198620 RepID=A0AA94JEL4_9PSED|nr:MULTISPECIES: hypothetical protein [Pseudomonas]MBT9268285.1 hypothetical protein [Pseudomonas sp. MG-9]RVD74448.1 hypothetical protein A9HBioS_5688 [Pseudomonas koreensis]
MQQPVRNLNLENIDSITQWFNQELVSIGQSIVGKNGIPLMLALKRDRLGHGPYPEVSLFEAANRIMSDLVILHGIAALLKGEHFPFNEYIVEFGNEDRNGFDIQAFSANANLAGEAFNVAPSYFTGKKNAALRKLRAKAVDERYKIIMFNTEARSGKAIKPDAGGAFQIAVDIATGQVQITPPLNALPGV